MNAYLCLALSAGTAVCAAAQEAPAAPSTHLDMAEALLDFLSRTELCLRSCQDAASVSTAIPQLQQLAQEARSLADIQKKLPEPTVQDFMALEKKMELFASICTSIQKHITRLAESGLLTDELRQILEVNPNLPAR